MGLASSWLIEYAKEVELSLEGYEHEVTNNFIDHVMKRHGNEETEHRRGQKAVTQADFEKIPEIVNFPDMALVGGKRGARIIIAYAKKLSDNTTLYFEEVIEGPKNKALRSMSLFKRIGNVDEKTFESIISGNGKTDISKAKTIAEPGGQPGKLPAESGAREPIPSVSACDTSHNVNDNSNNAKSQG